MKSELLYSAVLAVSVAVGCSRSEQQVPDNGTPILFTTQIGGYDTKATDLNQSFHVESFFSSEPDTNYFQSTQYIWNGRKYVGTQYFWPCDTSLHLDFYAVAPVFYTGTSGDRVELKPELDRTVTVTKTDGSTDIVASCRMGVSSGTTPVSLEFGHKLTKVTFKAVGADTLKKYVITGITLTANSSATYRFGNNSATENWGTSSDSHDYEFVAEADTILPRTSTPEVTGSSKYLIPSQADTLKAVICYEIYDEGGSPVGDRQDLEFLLPTSQWGINNSIVYKLELGLSSSSQTINCHTMHGEADTTEDPIESPGGVINGYGSVNDID